VSGLAVTPRQVLGLFRRKSLAWFRRHPECCRCGEPATVERNCPQVSDSWEPLCVGCDDWEDDINREIADFETREHGGIYGVPERRTRSIQDGGTP